MKGTMKAMVFYEPEKMKLEEIDIPQIGPDVLLGTELAGNTRRQGPARIRARDVR